MLRLPSRFPLCLKPRDSNTPPATRAVGYSHPVPPVGCHPPGLSYGISMHLPHHRPPPLSPSPQYLRRGSQLPHSPSPHIPSNCQYQCMRCRSVLMPTYPSRAFGLETLPLAHCLRQLPHPLLQVNYFLSALDSSGLCSSDPVLFWPQEIDRESECIPKIDS